MKTYLDHPTLNHLVVQVIPLTGALAHAGEHRIPTVVHRNVVDELHDHDRLAHPSPAEETNLTTFGVRRQHVDDLDAGDQNLLGFALLGEEWGGAMDGGLGVAFDGPLLVDGLPDDVEDAAQGAGTHRHLEEGGWEGGWAGGWDRRQEKRNEDVRN